MSTADPITRLNAALEGRYRIERQLGEGGMATVYLADDLRHERKVALKVLKPELAAVVGAERFLAEIKTTAKLQHPHILPLFDSGEAERFLFYVMPYVEGESLRERLDREQQLPLGEAVHIATNLAEALDYAHSQGVIHRDIKPANILLQTGKPVVSDFGIALALSAAGGGRLTETGLSLGTPHYMSPEQASGDRDVSPRSDIYSLGCVLYEMVAGHPPHTGPSVQSVLVRILTEKPRPLTEVRHTAPRHVAAAVAKAIEKLPADRFGSAKEFAAALGDVAFRYEPEVRTPVQYPPSASASEGGRASRLHASVTALLVVSTLVFGWLAFRPDAAEAPPRGGVVAFELTDDLNRGLPPIVGNDGSIAYPGPGPNGGLNLLIPGSLDPVPLEGTEGAFRGSFSPGGEWLAFVQPLPGGGYGLRRMPATGGPTSTLWETRTEFELAFGALAWGGDGWIYLATDEGIGRVPEEGGELELLLEGVAAADLDILPESRGLVFTLVSGRGPVSPDNHTVLLDLAERDTATLVEDGYGARWVSSGHVVYAGNAGVLYALPFDARRLEVTGTPVPVVDDAAVIVNTMGRFDVSPNGTLAYVRGSGARPPDQNNRYVLVSSNGAAETLPLDPTDHPDVGLSPDGRRIAYTRDDQIWIYDLDLGTNRPLTEEGREHHNPIWSPDGSEVVFTSQRGEDQLGGDLYARAYDGSSPARRIGGVPLASDYARQWLPDGTILTMVSSPGPSGGGNDIFRISDGGQAAPEAVLQADWNESDGTVSPDGRWLAYVSDEDEGVDHLFLRRWPGLGQKFQVTSGATPVFRENGHNIVWGADSRTIYFLRTLRLWTATFDGEDPSSVELADKDVDVPGPLWALHPDGRLLVSTLPGLSLDESPAERPALVVVSNWIRVLEERFDASR